MSETSDFSAAPGRGPQARRIKAPQDTAGGCRDRATADLALAATMDTSNRRLRFEQSAAAWTHRADTIQRLDESFEARRAAAAAMWADDEPAAPDAAPQAGDAS